MGSGAMKTCPLCGTEATPYDDVCVNVECKRPFQSYHQKAAAKRAALAKLAPPPTKIEFKSSRAANAGLGAGLLLLGIGAATFSIWASEATLLGSQVRRGGLLKLVEQAIGWELFAILIAVFGLWCANYGIVSLWKAINTTPDVTALPQGFEFHPAVKRDPASYDEISKWTVEIVSGNPVLWLYFHKPYWSLQGLFRRKTLKLEGGWENIKPLNDFLSNHPIMRYKFKPK